MAREHSEVAPRPTWPLGRTLALGLLASLGLFLVLRYVGAAYRTTERLASTACLSLGGEPIDRAALPMALKDLDGRAMAPQTLRGRAVLLNFWATWCPPCVEELPSLLELHRSSGEKDLRLLLVSVDEDKEQVKKFMQKYLSEDKNATPEILHDPERTLATAYGTLKFPETYLIDARGQVRYRFISTRDWSGSLAKRCVRSLGK